MYVHCINKDENVVIAIKNMNGIKKVTHDNTIDTAVHWSAKTTEHPDIIFCDELAINSKLDIETKKISRDKNLLVSLKQLRFNLPDSRIVILLEERRKKDFYFINALIQLAIYDFHFVKDYDVEFLQLILFQKHRTLKDVSDYLQNNELKSSDFNIDDENIETKFVAQQEKAEKKIDSKSKHIPGFLKNININKRLNLGRVRSFNKLFRKNEENIENQTSIKNSIENKLKYFIGPESSGSIDINKLQKEISNTNSKVQGTNMEAKVVSIATPWVSSGGSMFATLLAMYLSENNKVTCIDCDLSGRGLGVRFGVGLHSLSVNDWRYKESLLDVSGIKLYPLDPAINSNLEDKEIEKTFEKIIIQSKFDSEWIVLDVGKDSNSFLAKKAFSHSDVVLWVVKDDILIYEKTRKKWRERPIITARELLVMYGNGNASNIEKMFVLPCIQVKSQRDKLGMKTVLKLLYEAPKAAKLKVVTIGFKRVPRVSDVLFESFNTVDEALGWIENNRPNAVIVNENISKKALLEYDMKKLGIPVVSLSDLEELRDYKGVSSGEV